MADVSHPSFTRQERHALAATLLLALVFRGILCTQLACISRDGVHFIEFARKLADDPVGWLGIETKQPGYSYLLLGVHGVLGPILGGDSPAAWQRCGQLLGVIGGVAGCGLVFLLTRRLFDGQTASVAGILAAAWPAGAHLSADVLSDMPHLALYLLAIILACRAIERRTVRHMALCGFVAGAAYMLRQEALSVPLAAGLCWLRPRPRHPGSRRIMGAAVMALCFVVVVAPHSIAAGRIMPNKNLWDLFFGAASAPAVLSPPSLVLAHVIPWWQAPARMIEEWCKSGRYVVSTLFLLGLFLKTAPRAEPTGRSLAALAALLQLLAVQLRVGAYGEISSRYLVIPLALSIPWAAAGLLSLLGLIGVRIRARVALRPVDIRSAGVLVAVLPMLFYLARPVNDGKQHLRQAGEWLYRNAARNDRILGHDRLEQLMFYAGRTDPDQTWLRCDEGDSLEAIRGQVSRSAPQWFVDAEGSRRVKTGDRERFSALLSGAIPEVELVQSIGPAHVFRVVQPQEPSGLPGG